MDRLENYLYFPKCKITRCDSLAGYSGYNTQSCTFMIRSLIMTPKHYPKHFMLEGKPDFFFKLNGNNLAFQIIYADKLETIFGANVDLNKGQILKGKEVSVLVYFDPEADIKLDCIGIGLPYEETIVFNNDKPVNQNKSYANAAILSYKLNITAKKEKRQKL